MKEAATKNRNETENNFVQFSTKTTWVHRKGGQSDTHMAKCSPAIENRCPRESEFWNPSGGQMKLLPAKCCV